MKGKLSEVHDTNFLSLLVFAFPTLTCISHFAVSVFAVKFRGLADSSADCRTELSLRV